MESVLDLPKPRFQLEHALGLVRQDRWLLGVLRDGKLKVVADSSPESNRPYRRTRPLTHLARRCLHERRPLTVSSIATAPAPPLSSERRSPLRLPEHALARAHARDWELDWPALLYAPVGLPRQRPLGLLVIGSRACHWYTQQDIDYAAALGVTLSGLMLSLGGPLTRLSQRELAVARLIAQGLSLTETSAALQVELDAARGLVGRVLRKLALRSPGQLVDAWPQLGAVAASESAEILDAVGPAAAESS